MARGRGVAARGAVRRARKAVWGRIDAIFNANLSRRRAEVVDELRDVGGSRKADGVMGGKWR